MEQPYDRMELLLEINNNMLKYMVEEDLELLLALNNNYNNNKKL